MASVEKSPVQKDVYIATINVGQGRDYRGELVGFDRKIAQKIADDLESHPEKLQEKRFQFSYNNNWYSVGHPQSQTCHFRVEG